MSNRFNWDDDDGDFRDIPDEVSERAAPPAVLPPSTRDSAPAQKYSEPDYDGVDFAQEDFAQEDEDTDYSAVLSDARLRLEQGRLYEMIMNHDLFGGVDSDPKAIKHVQKQIRHFAKEQMEVMLGMRQTVTAMESMSVDLPFNSLEVKALRALASAATKGATEEQDVEAYSAPVVPRHSGLNQIGGRKPRAESLPPSLPKKRQAEKSRPLQSSPPAPVRRIKTDPKLEAELRSQGVEREYIEEAKRQLAHEKASDKAIDRMTREELSERNRQTALRTKQQVKAVDAVPMATPDQMEMMAIQMASNIQASPGLTRVMNLLNKAARK